MKKINPFTYLYYHLYLLQLEEYDIARFLKTIWHTKGVPRTHLRKKLVWTGKMILIAAITLSLIIGSAYIFSAFIFVFAFYVSYILIVVVVILLAPFDFFLKKTRIAEAKNKLSRFPKLRIVGIAGSYGKTTMKEVVSTILAQKYHVVKTPENINTPLGIADLILKKIDEKTEVLVVEMGEYKRGDIKEICSLVKPQIGIITGVNEAHLERMGNLENTVSTIFELAQDMDKDGLLVLNDDCKLIHDNYKKYVAHQQIALYANEGESDLKSGLLGRYAKGVLQAAEAVGHKLGLSDEQIRVGASLIKPLPHRLEPIEGTQGVLVIDDSYNGNSEGVKEAIHLLSTYTDRRKVYVTPGLVETGERSAEIHKQIGAELSSVANVVILIENSVTPYIAEGLMTNGFGKENIRWYKSSESAHADMANIVKPNDVVLFQNDWPDNYI